MSRRTNPFALPMLRLRCALCSTALGRPLPSSPFGKYRTLVATADTIGDPISEEEFAALEDKEGDDMCIRLYKQSARTNAHMRNYIHEHGCLYMDESDGYIFDNSVLVEEIRCKHVPVEEMEANATRGGITYYYNVIMSLECHV
ncbi:hypothetical protein PR202_ga26248 [Eleusine coracana subsp. coracana]|uniref:Uncharacterized protein n=1 Tax=Eleusine coracana subsp. coracana TaxID=191504 RepID=A0AAV5DBE8_ELECO|nr:hypothetical protein PR202_ga26248 [Eleusine coracana subsp. coracana]